MSLKFRVLGSIAALLVLSLLAGAGLLSWHARALVDLEVHTAFSGAAQSVRDTLRSDVQHTVTLREVVSNFQGQRHVRAALVNEAGKVIVQSQIGRLANPEDVVGAVLFLASSDAAMTTGATLPVDGGNLAMNAGGTIEW